jgi:hypothetical protein
VSALFTARVITLLIISPIVVYCWLRVFSKSFRRKYRLWWLALAGEDNDSFDFFGSLLGALVTTALFIYIAGLGRLWK